MVIIGANRAVGFHRVSTFRWWFTRTSRRRSSRTRWPRSTIRTGWLSCNSSNNSNNSNSNNSNNSNNSSNNISNTINTNSSSSSNITSSSHSNCNNSRSNNRTSSSRCCCSRQLMATTDGSTPSNVKNLGLFSFVLFSIKEICLLHGVYTVFSFQF